MIVIIIIAFLFMYPPLIEDDGISDHPIWSIIYAVPLFYLSPFLIIILGYQRDSIFYKIVGLIILIVHLLMIIFGKDLPITILTRKILSFIAATLMLFVRVSFVALFLYAVYMLAVWIPQSSYSLSEYCKDKIVIKPMIDAIQEKLYNFAGAVQDTKESLGVSYGITVSQGTINLDMIEHPSEEITVSVNNTHKDFSLNWTNSQKIRVEEVANKNGELTFNITARWEGDCELTFTLVDQNNDNKVFDTETVNVHVTNSAPDMLFEYNSHLYSCYDISMSWKEAEAYCNGLGGHLASINDENEQELIMAMSATYCKKQNIWIGGYFENDSWSWSDGSSFSYQNWDVDKPDNYGDNEFFLRYANGNIDYDTWSAKQGKWDDCAEYGSGEDSDAPLSSFGFVCEWDSREEYTSKKSIEVSENSVGYNGHSYLLYTDIADSWEEAENFCKSHGGHLATINDSEENSFIYNYMISCGYQSAYFGLVDRNYDGTWTWADGSNYEYQNWAEGEPSDLNEPYGMFYFKFSDGLWNDGRWGDDTTAFICEWENVVASSVQKISDFKAHISNITSSSHLANETHGNKTYVYTVEKAFDNDMSTCWSEGVDGYGVGESITISFDDVYEIGELSLWNGLCTSEDLFYKNSRLHNITVVLSDGNQYDFECSDGWDSRHNSFSFGENIETSSLTIIIQSVYEGDKYQDTCISEISVS